MHVAFPRPCSSLPALAQHAAHVLRPKEPSFLWAACPAALQNAVYGKALPNGAAAASPASPSSSVDSYVVEHTGELSKLPIGVARIVDGTRKLFEVRGHC